MLKKHHFKVKTAVGPFGAIFGRFGQLFIPNVWSHCLHHKMVDKAGAKNINKLLNGPVCAFQPLSPAALGSNPKYAIYVYFQNLIDTTVCH